MFHERMMELAGDGQMPADCICGGNRMHFSNCAIGKLERLKEKAKEFSDADYAHAAQGGGLAFSADHLRGSAAAYADMVTHIDQAIREARVAVKEK